MRMYSAYSDPQKDQTVKILVKYMQIDITIFFNLSQTWMMEHIRGYRPNRGKHVDSPDFSQSFQMESAPRPWFAALNQRVPLGRGDMSTEIFYFYFYGVLMFFLNKADANGFYWKLAEFNGL